MASLGLITAQITTVFAGIGWEPEIRGALTVAVATAVLMGSIWLLLVTNSGVRLGTLLSLAGFFGWMASMGIVWWIYGIGWVGSGPVWEVKEIVKDPAGSELAGIGEAVTGPVGDLPDTNCSEARQIFASQGGANPYGFVETFNYSGPANKCTPRAVELLLAYDGPEREQILQELLNPQLPANKIVVRNDDGEAIDGIDPTGTMNRDELFMRLLAGHESELADGIAVRNATIPVDNPRFASDAELAERVVGAVTRRDTRIDDLSLSALAATGPAVIDWADDAGYLDFNGWNLLSTAQSGEAVATADGELRELDLFDGHEFSVLDTFQQGGKPKRTTDSILGRVWHKITSTARITHPTNYAVVQAQINIDATAVPGQSAPLPEIRPEAASVSVVMERNLGNLRVVPALMTLISTILFLACCLVLHLRDLNFRDRVAAGVATAA